jgi:hypothetical protein
MTDTKSKVNAFIDTLEPKVKEELNGIIEVLIPALEAIHAYPPTTKDYYGDYMRLMSYQPKFIKAVALGLVAAGANTKGVKAAYDILSKNNDCV